MSQYVSLLFIYIIGYAEHCWPYEWWF